MNEKDRLIFMTPLSKTLGTLNYYVLSITMLKALQTLLLVLRATPRGRNLWSHLMEENAETYLGKWLAKMLHHV